MLPTTIEVLADRGEPHTGPRCDHTAGGVRCSRPPHDGAHHYRCASPACPGFPWRASVSPHPCAP
jgi:hypothetical protein